MKQLNLDSNMLLQSVDTSVKNSHGEYVGTIVEVTQSSDGHLEYIIISTKDFFGSSERYFAVAVASQVLKIDDDGNIVLKLDKNDLLFARGVAANNCPKPKPQFGGTVYELFYYGDSPKKKEASRVNRRAI